ncbi:MAG: hypothetical protein ACK5JT_20800, partial [Hyphomicrobiaceae bacterium]
LTLSLITFFQRFPISFRAERQLRRYLLRFGHSLIRVLDDMRWDRPIAGTWLQRQIFAYHMNQLTTLPQRISNLIPALPSSNVSDSGREALAGLTYRLEATAIRINDLARLRTEPADDVWVALLADDVREWRLGIRGVIAKLLDEPDASSLADLQERLDSRIKKLESLISEHSGDSEAPPATPQGKAHMRRVLSTYHGISLAVIGIARRARQISWQRLSENRF